MQSRSIVTVRLEALRIVSSTHRCAVTSFMAHLLFKVVQR